MSVIAAWKGEIGSDSMGVCEISGVWMPQQKLFVVNHEIVIAIIGASVTPAYVNNFSTILVDVIAAMEATKSQLATPYPRVTNGRGETVPSPFMDFITALRDFEMFFVTRRGRYLVVNDTMTRFDNDVPLVSGSGAWVASTALLLGQKMADAVQTAIEIAPVVRGQPQVYKQRDLKALKRTKARINAIANKMELR